MFILRVEDKSSLLNILEECGLQRRMWALVSQGNTVPGGLKFHGLITTFEMIMADCPELKKLQWRCVVIDEAHRLKNRNCKLLEGLKLMNLVSSSPPLLPVLSAASPSETLPCLPSSRSTRFC